MIDYQNLTPQTVSLVNVRTGVIYRYKEITVAADLNCTLTYSPVNPNSDLQDIQLSFDELPEVYDVIRELTGDPNLVVAAIVVLGEEQEDEGCPVCEELGDEVSPENFEEHCQNFATDIHEVIQTGLKTGNTDAALQLADSMFEALPHALRVRVVEISRQRAIENICEILSGKGS